MKAFPLTAATFVMALVFTPSAFAQDMDGAKFRTLEEGAWYHPVEPDSWVAKGANAKVLFATLARIEAATGVKRNPDQPDTQIEYGPGNWGFEFSASGEEAMKRAEADNNNETKRAAYLEALTYFHTAAAPLTNAPVDIAAFERASEAYQAAAALLPGDFTAVTIAQNGKSFEAFLQTPPGIGPFPVLIMSSGSDQSSLTAFTYYQKHLLPKGIAFLSVDVPGMGRSRAYDVSDGDTDQLFVAATNWAKTQPKLDANNIFVQGISFGGNAAARIFLSKPELDLAGVVYTCGPIHRAFMAPPEMYDHFPEFTMDGVRVRLGLPTTASNEETAKHIRVLSLAKQGLLEGEEISTPLLAITTNDDPVAPLEDMDKMLARAKNAERIVFDMPGHCPPHNLREAIVSAWILDNLR